MAAVSLPTRVLGRKIKRFGAIFVKMYLGHLGAWALPSGYACAYAL